MVPATLTIKHPATEVRTPLWLQFDAAAVVLPYPTCPTATLGAAAVCTNPALCHELEI